MRVLLVEDHADVAEMTLDILANRMGFEVVWTATGAAALSTARRLDPDLILVDLNLPDMSGLDLARELRATAGFEATLVALSGLSDSVDRKRALDAGFDGFYTKPMDLGLLRSIHAAARQGMARTVHSSHPCPQISVP